MLIYPEYTLADYLESKCDLAQKVAAIDAIINQSLSVLANQAMGVGNGIEMYELDDGQVKIKTGYRSLTEVTAGIDALRRLKNVYVNQLRGRRVILQDKSTFRGSSGIW